MSKSTRVSEGQVRELVCLAGELGELRGAEAAGPVWVGHLLAGVCRLTGAAAASHTVALGVHPTGEARLVSADVAGFDDAMLRMTGEFVRTGEPPDLIAHAITAVEAGVPRPAGEAPPRVMVHTLERLMPRPRWHASPHYNEFMGAMGLDDTMHATIVAGGPGAEPTDGAHLRLSRAVGGRPFTDRERGLLDLLLSSLAWMYRPAPASAGRPADALAGLPPRTREAAELLLAGLGEKQVAVRMGLSRHTVHDHVKVLYRHVGVSSRAEFMAKCGRR